jgi:ACT domain-containing protein
MKAIITVLGHDKIGIIAGVCALLADSGINILDISQTIVNGWFNMMMVVDVSGVADLDAVIENLTALGGKLGVDIRLQREDIFNAMHRI